MDQPTSTKPLNLRETSLNSATAVKKVATLNEEDFKIFSEQATGFVREDTGPCSALPRTLSNKSWSDLVDELVDDLGLGSQIWNAERKGFDGSQDLVYPEDRAEYVNLLLAVIED
jgi:hypothetical protein